MCACPQRSWLKARAFLIIELRRPDVLLIPSNHAFTLAHQRADNTLSAVINVLAKQIKRKTTSVFINFFSPHYWQQWQGNHSNGVCMFKHGCSAELIG